MELKNFVEAIAWCEEGLQIDSKEKKLVEMRAKADKLKVRMKAAWHVQCLSLWGPWRGFCVCGCPGRMVWCFFACVLGCARDRSWGGPSWRPKLIFPAGENVREEQ